MSQFLYNIEALPTYMYTLSDAAYRFYRTRCEERSVARRGLSSEKQKQKRRRERLTRVRHNMNGGATVFTSAAYIYLDLAAYSIGSL